MRQRIQTLDGLRFLAAIGVLWIHSWTTHGNPRCQIGRFDVAGFLALGRNGVDLFFVISGFCMYYFYASKSDFSYQDFYSFLIKRWVRLSPAFYAATIVYILVHKYIYLDGGDSLLKILTSIFYLNSIFQEYNAAPQLWTLGVEWQFYILIPFLLIYQNKLGFKKTFFIIFGSLFLTAIVSVFILKAKSDFFTNQILFRAVEFGLGVLVARLLIVKTVFLKKRIFWLVVFIIITNIGRVFISKQILDLSSNYYNLFKLVGFTAMGCGFSGILYLSLTSVKWLNYLLGNRLFKAMGRISYSFYLWHELILRIVAGYVIHFLPTFNGIIVPAITTLISAIVLYPVSMLSYSLLEKPFLAIGNLTRK